MPRFPARRFLIGLFLVAACAVGSAPREARAFHGHHGFHHGGWHGGWHGGFGFGHCGYSPWGYGGLWGGGYGWGVPCWPLIGNVSYGTGFAVGGTRFWSGTTVFGVPAWGGFGGCGPVWGVPAWGGFGWGAPGCIGGGWGGPRFRGVGAWYGGWNPGPAWGWNPGPAPGWAIPFAGIAPAGVAPVGAALQQRVVAGRRPLAVDLVRGAGADAVGRENLGAPPIDAAVEVAIRTSNAPARARAARLVALGDRHLRDAIDDPTKLPKAIDAYRRAGAIAADQPDTFLRQAIALTAAGKSSAAATALGRAVAIDGRLIEGANARGNAQAPRKRDPVFDGLAADAVAPLVGRSSKLLSRIFKAPGTGGDADSGDVSDNWIARRWFGRDAEPVMVAIRP
jgi:hypothetical protein